MQKRFFYWIVAAFVVIFTDIFVVAALFFPDFFHNDPKIEGSRLQRNFRYPPNLEKDAVRQRFVNAFWYKKARQNIFPIEQYPDEWYEYYMEKKMLYSLEGKHIECIRELKEYTRILEQYRKKTPTWDLLLFIFYQSIADQYYFLGKKEQVEFYYSAMLAQKENYRKSSVQLSQNEKMAFEKYMDIELLFLKSHLLILKEKYPLAAKTVKEILQMKKKEKKLPEAWFRFAYPYKLLFTCCQNLNEEKKAEYYACKIIACLQEEKAISFESYHYLIKMKMREKKYGEAWKFSERFFSQLISARYLMNPENSKYFIDILYLTFENPQRKKSYNEMKGFLRKTARIQKKLDLFTKIQYNLICWKYWLFFSRYDDRFLY